MIVSRIAQVRLFLCYGIFLDDMKDQNKTKLQLIKELTIIRRRVAELEASAVGPRQTDEETLRESEARFRDLYDQAPVGYHEIDTEGRIIQTNYTALAMLGYAEKEILGRHPWEFIVEREASHQAVVNKLSGSESPSPYERTWRRKDGTLLPTLMQDHVMRDADGRISGIRATIQDITERKRAEERLLAYQKELRSLVSELTLTEDQERKRIAADLHDRTGQALAVSKIKLGALRASASSTDIHKPLDELRGLFDQIIQDIRSLTFELSPPILYELELEAAAEWLTEQIQEEHGISIKFENDSEPKPLNNDVRVLLFRTLRELLINVVKHAHAHHAKVSIIRNDNDIQITVEDDGIGFDTSRTSLSGDRPPKLGLFQIRERLNLLGGRFLIVSTPKEGTRAVLTAPLTSNATTQEG